MKLPGLLYKIGEVDTSMIEEHVSRLTQQEWIEWDLRQNRYKVHSATESYPFLFSEYGEQPKEYNQDTELWNVVKPVIDRLEKFYNRKAAAIVVVKLKPKTNIIPHTDGGWFVNTNRLHIPIVTDPNILFTFIDKKVHLKKGSIYEINNLVEHGVVNPTAVARVHLMVDLDPKHLANPTIQKSSLESIGYNSLEINELA